MPSMSRRRLLARALARGCRSAALLRMSAATGLAPGLVLRTPEAVASTPGAAAGAGPLPQVDAGFAPVRADARLSFPRDHGAHPEYRTEWWYVTGWLERAQAAPCGFQVTFFRSRTTHDPRNPSRFAPGQLLFAHAALALPERTRLVHAQRAARAGFGLASFEENDTGVRIGDWSLARSDADRYRARITGGALALDLEMGSDRAPVLQGAHGFSRKGPQPEQASHYYSRPQLRVTGRIATDGADAAVDGRGWLDHEWSSTLLDEEASGWDWIGINLDDGGSLMAFRIRRRDGTELWSHVAWRDADGRLRHPAATGVRFEPLRWWRSARSAGRYPVEARVTVLTTPRLRLRLIPLIDDQEIDARASTGGHYWEGAVRAVDADTGASLGRGYHELTGYAEPLAL